MRFLSSLALLAALVACGGTGGSDHSGRAVQISGPALAGGVCPSPDPVRDGPLVDAIRTGNRAPIEAALTRDPADARALAAQAIVTRRGTPDADQAACFAPYLT